jgi:ABC-2 type transport system ATP-binding protein
VGVLAGGRLVAEGTPAELIGSVGATTVRFEVPAGVHPAEVLGVVPTGAKLDDGWVEFPTETVTADVHAITGWALGRGIELTGLTVTRPTLEDVFLSLAGADDTAELPS